MAISVIQVHAKAKGFVDTLASLPTDWLNQPASSQLALDYCTLRRLALEAIPATDVRLLGPVISARTVEGRQEWDVTHADLLIFARQILEQLVVAQSIPSAATAASRGKDTEGEIPKAYCIAEIRETHPRAYCAWTPEDETHLEARFSAGATIAELAEEFGRKPGGIRSRLVKLGLLGEGD